jgi:hypothetical protein
MRVQSHDMAFFTVNDYRKILKRDWGPALGTCEFPCAIYSDLVDMATSRGWKTKKTYNNCEPPSLRL